MSAPNNPQSVKIARKRGAEDQEPPSTLIVQPGEGEASQKPTIYIRQSLPTSSSKRRDVSIRTFGESNTDDADVAQFAPQTGPKNELGRRLFKLKLQNQGPAKRVGGKRGRGRDDVATFVEQGRQEKSWRSASPGAREVDGKEVEQYAGKERPFKRPSRQPRARMEEQSSGPVGSKDEQTEAERGEMESLAQYLHEAALEEVEMEQKVERETQGVPTGMGKVAAPKISGQRARELHRRRVESNKELASQRAEEKRADVDTDMSDGDYIYDTYVLAPLPSESSTSGNSMEFNALLPSSSDIGYLIIAPEDKDAWEAYIDDLLTSDDGDGSDSEDSNAEDHYGADYPEDELSEDDEFDLKAYGYRGEAGAESDGDEDGYESDDAAAWSDGEKEAERMMNPFKYDAYRGPKLGGMRRRLEGEAGEV